MALFRHIPQGYTLYAKDERFGFEVYASTSPLVVAVAFGGKRSKPYWHFRFKDEARLKAKIEDSLNGLMEWSERKAKYKAERTKPHNVQLGDIFRSSWGYDQTNIDFYECTKVMGSMIEIREIAQMREEKGFMTGDCVPSPGHYIGKPMKKRVSMDSNEPSVNIASYASAYRIKPIAKVANKPIFESSNWTAYA
jgi:hypothetical protein